MASSPNQFYLFATQIASPVILIGIATISVLAFCPSKSVIGETFRSLPVARKLSFGTQLVALQVAFLVSPTYILNVYLDVRLDANCT